MKLTIVRYTVKPGMIDENERLVRAVFAELAREAPTGLRYASLRGEDGGFVHLVGADHPDAPTLPSFPAFTAFAADIAERVIAPPHFDNDAIVVGNYRMLG
ncbi:MAG: hypothetical protein ABR975_16620 [Vulcanimicrobiaceae bacterium]|jgi:hypothetical protein